LFFSLIGGSDYRLIYRHYATLYFVFCVDSSESELGILDLVKLGNFFCGLSDQRPVLKNNSVPELAKPGLVCARCKETDGSKLKIKFIQMTEENDFFFF
jgi:hypothetical protein